MQNVGTYLINDIFRLTTIPTVKYNFDKIDIMSFIYYRYLHKNIFTYAEKSHYIFVTLFLVKQKK